MERNLAIMFVDIVDSTRLYERLGNIQAAALTQGALEQVRGIVTAHHGSVVKSLGDGLMCTYPHPDQLCLAAAAMIECQPGLGVGLRVGGHYGPVVCQDNDIFGDATNTTARVQSLAKPNEILVTGAVVERLSSLLRLRMRLIDSTTVKGKTLPISIFQFRPREEEDDSIEATISGVDLFSVPEAPPLTLALRYLDQTLEVSRYRPKVRIGRDGDNDIRILSKRASRGHGSIEFERESFLIKDHSSNGTFIKVGDASPLVLRRDATRLVGEGLIGFGAAPGEDGPGQEHVAWFRSSVV